MKKWIPVLYLLTGLFCGWLIFGGEKTDNASLLAESPTQVWTCSMHPQIRLHEAVPCPLCGMALTPIGETETSDSLTLVLSETAARLAMIQTASVTRGKAEKKLLLQGKLVPDERFVSQITAPYPGRIERLRINTAGMEVEKNAIVADLYSPELISAQTEFFDATSLRMMAPEVYLMARNRLRRWNIPEDIIEGIEYGKPLLKDFPIYAPVSGTVIRRMVTEGQYVEEGTELFEIANLGRIWAVFDVYEPDLPWIKKGNSVSFTTPSAPGKTFSGKIAFIDPLVDPETRTVTIRVEVPNPDRLLKPEMYIYGSVSVSETAQQPPIVVPKTAVLWTGSHSLVYIHIPETKPPVFQLREVVLGPDLGSEYVILEGLAEGEEIVVNGVFKIDAAAQLAGKYSMMNPPHPHSRMKEMMQTPALPDKFAQNLPPLFHAYFGLKNALVASNPSHSSDAAKKLIPLIIALNSAGPDEETEKKWKEISRQIHSAAEKIQAEKKEVSIQREAFFQMSNAFIQLIRNFPLSELTVYQDYCPMAFDNAGAGWLSEKEEILNPYFGDKMLRCGVVKHRFTPVKP